MLEKIYISKPVCWAPGVETAEDWQNWKNGKIEIQKTEASPGISFTPPLFRRRLSQLSKMVIQTVHDLIEETNCGDIKQIFSSFYGDIKRQFDVSRQTLVDAEILPASFSYSVFNAPIALASLACKLKSGYSVVFPANNKFKDSILAAVAPVLCKDEKEVMFIFGNELIPEEYKIDQNEPFTFALVISAEQKESFKEIDLIKIDLTSPQAFLKAIL